MTVMAFFESVDIGTKRLGPIATLIIVVVDAPVAARP
jgi:hypothetical protein